MDSIFTYLINLSVCTGVLYSFYLIFLSGDTFYVRNRCFLLSLLVLSAIIPLFSFSGFYTSTGTDKTTIFTGVISSGNQVDYAVSEKIRSIEFKNILFFIYLALSMAFFVKTVYSVFKTRHIIKSGVVVNSSFPRLVLVNHRQKAFSFFPYIVISEELFEKSEYSDIIEHEKVHIKQFHTFDLILCEILIWLQWFNPFIWLTKRSILLNHEYLADSISIKQTQNRKEYQYKLLNLSVQSATVGLTHSFSRTIKKRLIMINKKPTNSYAAMKGFLVVPFVAMLFLLFSFRSAQSHVSNPGDDSLFSKSSITEIYKFVFENIEYPEEAKNAYDTGSVYILVKMEKGGIIRECKVVNDLSGVKAPLFDEIVVVGYGPATPVTVPGSKDHPFLKSECLRIANKLASLNIPEWKDKDIAFILNFKFMLK